MAIKIRSSSESQNNRGQLNGFGSGAKNNRDFQFGFACNSRPAIFVSFLRFQHAVGEHREGQYKNRVSVRHRVMDNPGLGHTGEQGSAKHITPRQHGSDENQQPCKAATKKKQKFGKQKTEISNQMLKTETLKPLKQNRNWEIRKQKSISPLCSIDHRSSSVP
jgi:hypothetical protein